MNLFTKILRRGGGASQETEAPGELLARAQSLFLAGQFAEAQAAAERALEALPESDEAQHLLGTIALQRREFLAAGERFGAAIARNPGRAATHVALGIAQQELGDFDRALASFEQAAAIDSGLAEAHVRRGMLLNRLNRPQAALESLDRALAAQADIGLAHFQRGVALQALGRQADAAQSYAQVVALDPGAPEPRFFRAVALHAIGRGEEALADLQHVIETRPDVVDPYSLRGNILLEGKSPAEALPDFERAIELQPGVAGHHYNRGIALKDLGRFEEAIASFDAAITIDPAFGDAFVHRGWAQRESKQLGAACASLDRALTINPDYPYLFGLRLQIKMARCDWSRFGAELDELRQRVEQGRKAIPAFPALLLLDSARLHYLAARTYVADAFPSLASRGAVGRRPPGDRIRIGYFSPDFRKHAVAFLIAELFELHDRKRFEIIGFSCGPDTRDGMRERIERAVDRFVDIRGLTDAQAAAAAQEQRIDIAVDLAGFTTHARTGIFSRRAAPIQVNYLGYPGTLAADYYDYIVADRTTIPAEDFPYYTEKVVWLPDSYQVNDRKRTVADRQFTRQELGLPPDAFVFCCFNNSFKITPGDFASWMRILAAVPRSVLWLLEDNADASSHLVRAAQSCGIGAERLVFAPRMPMEEHLARQRAGDLFLDTLPYNAHTTASDALWVGLPVLTRMGRSFPGRVAASLLRAAGLPELVTTTPEQFEARAVELATGPAELDRIRHRLQANRAKAALFDTPRFARHIESAYLQMVGRDKAGLSPEHIAVPESLSGGS